MGGAWWPGDTPLPQPSRFPRRGQWTLRSTLVRESWTLVVPQAPPPSPLPPPTLTWAATKTLLNTATLWGRLSRPSLVVNTMLSEKEPTGHRNPPLVDV